MRSFYRLTAGILRQTVRRSPKPAPNCAASHLESSTSGSNQVADWYGWQQLAGREQAVGSFRAPSWATLLSRCHEGGGLAGATNQQVPAGDSHVHSSSTWQMHPPWTGFRAISTASNPGWGTLTAAAQPSPSASLLTTPVRSPLLPSGPGTGSESGSEKAKAAPVGRAILTGIKQSPKKVGLVATLIRGMRVEDAMAQLAVSTKRAAKTVAKLVHAARANGVTNHGMAESKLFVAEAFVGKGRYLKRMWQHGRGKSGVRERARSMLTVIVKEMSPKQEGILAKAYSYHWSKRRPSKLVPHRLITVGKKTSEAGGSGEKKTKIAS